ncbi:MAG: hypothetical protein ACK5HY_03610 [Parahaliea sp.]
MMKTPTLALLLPVLAISGLSATTSGHAGQAQDQPGLPASCDTSHNLVANPDFATNERGRISPWGASQHAGEHSFELTLKDGEAWISRIATQPWYTLTQTIPMAEAKGHELVYLAELKLDLNTEGLTHGFEKGGGLSVTVRGNPDPVLGGDSLLFSRRFDHEPHLGTHDWTPVMLAFQVPADATLLRVGFAHYANGTMAVRKPALYICDDKR